MSLEQFANWLREVSVVALKTKVKIHALEKNHLPRAALHRVFETLVESKDKIIYDLKK